MIPPLLGAVIGYVTNYIAIRMLFRPLKAWRICGLRLPLTPGIIPSKRGDLARKMGEMVGDHLLTADDVAHAFDKSSIRRELRNSVDDKLSSLIDHQLGPAADLVPERFRGRFDEIVILLQGKAAKLIFQWLQSDEFAERLQGWFDSYVEQALGRDLDSFMTEQRYEQLLHHLHDKYRQFLSSENTEAMISSWADDKIEQLLGSEQPLRELLPDELIDMLLQQLEQELPQLLEKFAGLLHDPAYRERLVDKGKAAIIAMLDSLGDGMANLLSGFIDLNKIYEKIPDFLDKAGEEIAVWLRQESSKEQLAALLRQRIELLLERSPASFVEQLPYEKIKSLRRFVRTQAIRTVQSQRTLDSAVQMTEGLLKNVKHRPFSDLLQQVLPQNGLQRSRELLVERLLTQLRSDRVHARLQQLIKQQSEQWIYHKQLGVLAARLPGDLRQELEQGCFQLVEEQLKKEAPRLVQTLNVKQMVEDKVNSLDLLQVEGLLMGIMKEQFKYINLFGALLGFLIGFINLLVLRLG